MPLIAPRRVTEVARELRDALGLPVTTEHDKGVWRIAAESTRAAVTIDFTRTRGSRWSQHGSTLRVDGKPRRLANDLAHLAQIFAHPDGAPAPDLTPLSAAGEVGVAGKTGEAAAPAR